MRHIERVEEPIILAHKHKEWQEKYDAQRVAKPSVRPDSSKYGHQEIRNALYACSFGKCFYCESKLSGDMKEIDHFREVAIIPEQAYTWSNLYLSCNNCNNKINHKEIPVEEVLDCRNHIFHLLHTVRILKATTCYYLVDTDFIHRKFPDVLLLGNQFRDGRIRFTCFTERLGGKCCHLCH